MNRRILRTLFGDAAEKLEDRGDELRLNGFHREAVYCYGQALQRPEVSSGTRQLTLERKLAECREAAFRQMLEEAESLAGRGRRREALALLADAERFASGTEEIGVAHARRLQLETRQSGGGALLATGLAGPGGSIRPLPPVAAESSAPLTRGAPAVSAEGSPASTWIPFDPDEDLETRLERLQAETRAHPESALAHEMLGDAYRAAGRFEEARAEYESAYRRNPDRLRLVIESARLLKDSLGDIEGAVQRLDQAARHHRPTAASLPLHCERLLWLAESGRVEEALAGFGDLLSVTGLDRGFLFFNRAGLQEQSGLLEGARSDLEAAIQVSPENLIYRERLADVCVHLRERLPEALQAIDEALAVDAHDFARPYPSREFVNSEGGTFSPDRARLQYKAARILFLLERDAEARLRVEEGLVICRDPRVEEALLELRRSLET